MAHKVDSERAGGPYLILEEPLEQLEAWVATQQLSEENKAVLTTWLVNQRKQGTKLPLITAKVVSQVHDGRLRPIPPYERADRLLQTLVSQHRLGESIPYSAVYDNSAILANTESIDKGEIRILLDHLVDSGYTQEADGSNRLSTSTMKVRLAGYQRVAELEAPNSDSRQVFIAMWFDKSVTALREAIKDTTREIRYEPFVVDEDDDPDVRKICDKIEAEIRRSRLVVADFTHSPKTGARGSVYFEAGLARGLDIPVIWTCHEDQIDVLHFDTRQYPHIPWHEDRLSEFQDKLKYRIQVLLK